MAPHPTNDEEEPFSRIAVYSKTTSEGWAIWHFGVDRPYEVLGLMLEGPHNFFSFSEEEAHRLVSSAGLPLFGSIEAENYVLLDPCEATLQRSMFNAGVFGEDTCPHPCHRPWDVYDILEYLVDAFGRVETRTPRALSQANIEHVATITKRLRTLIQSLEDPRTKLFSGGKPMDDLVRDCKAELAKFNRWASIVERTEKPQASDQSTEEFIRGPLADVYERLFHRGAGGNEKGPFARFGACFFEMVGYPSAPATIARAIKKTPRAPKKKRPHHRAWRIGPLKQPPSSVLRFCDVARRPDPQRTAPTYQTPAASRSRTWLCCRRRPHPPWQHRRD